MFDWGIFASIQGTWLTTKPEAAYSTGFLGPINSANTNGYSAVPVVLWLETRSPVSWALPVTQMVSYQNRKLPRGARPWPPPCGGRGVVVGKGCCWPWKLKGCSRGLDAHQPETPRGESLAFPSSVISVVSYPCISNTPEFRKREKRACFSEVSLCQSGLLTALKLKIGKKKKKRKRKLVTLHPDSVTHLSFCSHSHGKIGGLDPERAAPQAHPETARVTASTLQGKLADLGRGWGEEAARLLCNSDGNVLLGLFTICWAHRHFSIWPLINVLTTSHSKRAALVLPRRVFTVSAAEFLSNSMASSLNLLRRIFVRNSYSSLEVSQMDNIWMCTLFLMISLNTILDPNCLYPFDNLEISYQNIKRSALTFPQVMVTPAFSSQVLNHHQDSKPLKTWLLTTWSLGWSMLFKLVNFSRYLVFQPPSVWSGIGVSDP